MKLGLGLGLGSGSGSPLRRILCPFFNGIPAESGATFTGGPVATLDYLDVLQYGALNVPSITGGRWATTLEEGASGEEMNSQILSADYYTQTVEGVWTFADGTASVDNAAETSALYPTAQGGTAIAASTAIGELFEVTIVATNVAGLVRYWNMAGGFNSVVSGTNVFYLTAGAVRYSYLTAYTGSTIDVSMFSVKRVIPQCLTTDTEGAELYPSTLVGGIRKFTDADPLEFKRYLSMPAGTNLFVNPTAPATQDIDLTSVGTGDYTLSVYGSGSVTVAANTATGTGFGTASAGSDVAFAITAVGTITLTVTDTPDIVQVEQNGFATSPVDGVRQATRLVESVTGKYRANNLCGIIQSIPMGAGQSAWLLHSYVDANNGFGILQEPTQITFRKTAGGVDTDCSVSYTHAAGTPVRIGWVQTASGMRIKEQHWTGAAWSSWSSYAEVTTGAGKADLQVAATYEVGSKNGSEVFAGNIQLARPWWSSDPDCLEGV